MTILFATKTMIMMTNMEEVNQNLLFKKKRRHFTDDTKKPRITPKSTIRPSKTAELRWWRSMCDQNRHLLRMQERSLEILLNNRTVVLKCGGIDVEIAQRIGQFLPWFLLLVISGNLLKISNYIFIITWQRLIFQVIS